MALTDGQTTKHPPYDPKLGELLQAVARKRVVLREARLSLDAALNGYAEATGQLEAYVQAFWGRS